MNKKKRGTWWWWNGSGRLLLAKRGFFSAWSFSSLGVVQSFSLFFSLLFFVSDAIGINSNLNLIHYFTLSYFILPNPFLAFCPCFWFNITELQCKMGPKMSYSLVSFPYENGFSWIRRMLTSVKTYTKLWIKFVQFARNWVNLWANWMFDATMYSTPGLQLWFFSLTANYHKFSIGKKKPITFLPNLKCGQIN